MPKCWIHGETAQPKKTTPLKTHPGFPEDSIKQGLALALVSKPQVRDLAIQPYRYWEFEKFSNQTEELKKSLKDLKEKLKKKEEGFLEGLEQSKLSYQFLNQEKNKEIAELNNKLNQLITRILNISEKPVGTFDPELKKTKGIKELLERYSVNSLEELVIFINKAIEKDKEAPKINQELQDFLTEYSASNLAEVAQTWQNTEADYLKKIKELKASKGDSEEVEDLITERDELTRDKKTLEQQNLALNNRLTLKQQEVSNKDKALGKLNQEKGELDKNLNKKITEKNSLITTLQGEIRELKKQVEEWEKTAKTVDIFIEPIKIEGKERSVTTGMMTQHFFDLTITVSKRGENRDEGPHIIGDAWKAVGLINTYSEDKDDKPGSLTGKKVQTIIIPNAGNSKKDWVGDKFTKSGRNTKQTIRITGPFEKYDETSLTLTFKPDNVELKGILMSHSL